MRFTGAGEGIPHGLLLDQGVNVSRSWGRGELPVVNITINSTRAAAAFEVDPKIEHFREVLGDTLGVKVHFFDVFFP